MQGPIAIGVKEGEFGDEFVELARDLIGGVPIVAIREDDPSQLPADCSGLIGYGLPAVLRACLGRGVPVYMIGHEEWDLERGARGHKLFKPEKEWRASLSEKYVPMLLTSRAMNAQEEFRGQLPEQLRDGLTWWSAELKGESGACYLFKEVLGIGGTAVVAKVSDEEGRMFAAKVPSAHRFPIEMTVKRFLREAEILSEVEHENVVRIVDVAKMGGAPVVVMEYIDGGTLHERLLDRGWPEVEVAIEWLEEALAGVAALHRLGIIHRDLTPKNLLFRGDGKLVVSDFGTVRHLDDETLTNSVDQLGSLIYIAPEQFSDPHTVGRPADVYSIGQLAFLLIAGFAPQGNTGPLKAHTTAVPDEIAALVESCRSFDPDDRPADAVDALEQLRVAIKAVVDRQRAWCPAIELCEELFDPLAVAAKRLREGQHYPATPHQKATQLLGEIRSAIEKIIEYLEECERAGRQLVRVQQPGDEAHLPTNAVAVVRGPGLQVSTGLEDEFSPVWTAWHGGSSNALLMLLADWREQLLEGEVALLPSAFLHDSQGLSDSYDNSIDLGQVWRRVKGG